MQFTSAMPGLKISLAMLMLLQKCFPDRDLIEDYPFVHQCTMGFHITFQEMEHIFFKSILRLQFSSKIAETFFTW